MTSEPFSPVIASIERNETIPRKTAVTLKMQLTLLNGSVLHVTENHVRLTGEIDYAYQWQTADHQLIHRWDNAEHHNHISTFPYHQHVGSEENVQPSEPMTLEKMLAHIATRIDGPSPTSD